MALSIVEEIANHLADMPPSLPVYPMQFPSDVANCIAIFPVGGSSPTWLTAGAGIDCIDYPGVQIQVRYTDPHNAYMQAEAIRVWLDENLPAGYLQCATTRSAPDNLTNPDDLSIAIGPCYRFAVNFDTIKDRS